MLSTSRRSGWVGSVLGRACLVVLLMLGAATLAQTTPDETDVEPTPPLGALRIEPAGRQVFDIATGETVLPDGGVIYSAEGSIRLEADVIRYLEGRYVEAETAVVDGAFGTVRGASVRFDLEAGTIRIAGGVDLERDALRLGASAMEVSLRTELVRVDGPVEAQNPDFEAAALLLDVRTGTALLRGPYAFRGDPFTLTADDPDALLQLVPVELEAGTTYDAASEVDPDVLERFAPLLEAPDPPADSSTG